MKNLKELVFIALLGIFMGACSKDEITDVPVIPPTPEPEEPVTPPEPKPVFLGINPYIAGIEPVTRGIITNFTDNDRIGIYLTAGKLGTNYQDNPEAANLPAMYMQGNWKVEKDIELTEEGTAFAYYPYSNDIADATAIPLEIATQTDYLYATSSIVDKKNPIAQVGMKHALALVSIRIRKNDYQHTGKLSKVEILDVQETGTMNIATGEITRTGANTTYSVDRDLILDDNDLVKTQMIMLPMTISEAGGNVRFRMTIDDKYYIWDVPKSHIWEAGKEYTYTLNLSKTPEELPDLELDIDYWTKYGKDDNIQLEDHTQPGSAYYRVVDVRMSGNPFGRTVVTGEPFVFEGVVYEHKDGFKGRVKYSLWQGDKMIEQYPSYYIDCHYYNTVIVPCFITVQPGTYRLKMLLQEEGSNKWILPSERYSDEVDWIYNVQNDNSVPSLKSMNMEGFEPTSNLARNAKLHTPFNMEFVLTNRAAIPIKGEIKAVWHRTFTGEFHAISANDGVVWEDEIGRISVDIPASTEEYKGKISCVIVENRNSFVKYGPQISFYYKEDGTEIWKLMRGDLDSELQRWKGADSDKIIGGSNDYPEKWWGLLGGFNYQYVWLE